VLERQEVFILFNKAGTVL